MRYTDLAARVEVRICTGCEAWRRWHYRGRFIRTDGELVAHWSDRRLNRMGLYNFLRRLRLASQHPGAPMWMRLWLSDTEAVAMAAQIGYRIPRWYSTASRHHVRALLGDPAQREHNEDARRAWKWATPE